MKQWQRKKADLKQLGFNIQLLGSKKCVLNKLQTLSDEGLEKLREAFIKHCDARFMKYFFCHIPFGRKEVYAKEVMKTNLERIVHLIKVYRFLLQSKVYLFWSCCFHAKKLYGHVCCYSQKTYAKNNNTRIYAKRFVNA